VSEVTVTGEQSAPVTVLASSDRCIILHALATEIENQKHEQTRVKFQGNAWHGRQHTIDQCQRLSVQLGAASWSQTESERTSD
jgi:hypothetical protein